MISACGAIIQRDDYGSQRKNQRKKPIVTQSLPIKLSYPMTSPTASQDQLKSLENALLSRTGDVPLHRRFRALFTLKSLKNEDAVRIISRGAPLHSSGLCGDRIFVRFL